MRSALSLSILVLLFLLPALQAQSEFVYRVGDWIEYGVLFEIGSARCLYILRLEIENVSSQAVSYSLGIVDTVSNSTLCNSVTDLLITAIYFETRYPINISNSTPESRNMIISPRYTGNYTVDNMVLQYYKGVLVSAEALLKTPFAGTQKIFMVNTSTEELKKFAETPPKIETPRIVITITQVAYMPTTVFNILTQTIETTHTYTASTTITSAFTTTLRYTHTYTYTLITPETTTTTETISIQKTVPIYQTVSSTETLVTISSTTITLIQIPMKIEHAIAIGGAIAILAAIAGIYIGCRRR
ncbi:MAG: hypothetical protein QXT53_07195 [Ignisphaera sp.]